MFIKCFDKFITTLGVFLLIFCLSNLLAKTIDQCKYLQKSTKVTRKFNTSKFFNSVANACANAGKAAGAQTEKEKQQAACDLVGAICQSVAVLSEKTSKRSPNYTYLQIIRSFPTNKDSNQFITKVLANKEEGSALLNELSSLLKELFDEQWNQK